MKERNEMFANHGTEGGQKKRLQQQQLTQKFGSKLFSAMQKGGKES